MAALSSAAAAALNTPSPYSYISSYLAERADDAATAIKGIVAGSGSSRYLDAQNDSVTLIRSLLDSNNEEDRLQGLTRVVALITKGRDAKSFLPLVLKLTSSPSLSVRKLVYIVLQRYAPSSPDVALLSINSFQRDLSDSSPLIRGMALRALAALRVTAAAPITMMALAKACRDSSPYVRKIAALAIVKCYELDPASLPDLIDHLRTLLSDRSPFVLGAALWTFTSLPAQAVAAPEPFSLIHPHYRKTCHALLDMDAWSQVNAIDLLARYAKANFAAPAHDGPLDKDLALILAKADPLLSSNNAAVVMSTARLFFHCAPSSSRSSIARPILRLLHSPSAEQYLVLQNAYQLAVISPDLFAPHLTSFLPRSADSAQVAILKMDMLVLLCVEGTGGATSSSMTTSRRWKLALSELAEGARSPSPLVARAAVRSLGALAQKMPGSADTVLRTLLRLVQARGTRDYISEECLQIIKALLQGREKHVGSNGVGEAAHPISDESNTAAIVAKLSHMLFGTALSATRSDSIKRSKALRVVGKDAITNGHARSCLYWLVGQFCRLPLSVRARSTGDIVRSTIAEIIAPDVLRRAAVNFAKESTTAKLQIITMSTKLSAFLPSLQLREVSSNLPQAPHLVSAVAALHSYILQLARYDVDFDVRDRARFCKAFSDGLEEHSESSTAGPEADEESRPAGVKLRREQVLHVLFTGKPSPALLNSQRGSTLLEGASDNDAIPSPLGSLSLSLGGKLVPGWRDTSLQPWSADPTPPSLREPEESAAPVSSASNASTVAGAADTQRAASALAASTARSFSSETWAASASGSESAQLAKDARVNTLTGVGKDKRALAVVLEPTKGESRIGSQAESRYKDLETFLDEPDEEAESEEEEEESEEDNDGSDGGEDSGDADDDSSEVEEDSGEDSGDDEDAEELRRADYNGAPHASPSIPLPAHENEWAT